MILIKRVFRQMSFSSLLGNRSNLLKSTSLGLMMWILAYPLTFTVQAYAISRKVTRVHFAAVVAASILFASELLKLMNIIQRDW